MLVQATAAYGIALKDALKQHGTRDGGGQRAADQESAQAQDRCRGEPAADEAAHLRTGARLVSTGGGHAGSAGGTAALVPPKNVDTTTPETR